MESNEVLGAGNYRIPTQKEVDESRWKGDIELKKMVELSGLDVTYLRKLAKNDLFFLAHGILGYKKLSQGLHNDLCKWLEKTSNEQYREILLPRSHYKSTICTISGAIQISLPDDSGSLPYPHNLGPNIRVLISHETSEAATRFLYSITQHFMGNGLLMALFPELVPNTRLNRINKNELELPRTIIASEPTFDTMGVAGKSQGRHYNKLFCDDLYGAAARDSEAEKKSTIQWIDNLQSYLITPKTDKIDFIGTRWAYDDCYSHIHEVYGSQLKKYIRAVEEVNPVTKKKEPIFPEEFTTESLNILRKNRQIWNAQYVNNPSEGNTRFKVEDLRYFNKVGIKEIAVMDGVDRRRILISDLDKLILIDPAPSGLAGVMVTGTDKKNNIYTLEAIKKEWNPTDFTNEIFNLVLRYSPRKVLIEDVLFSVLYQPWWIREMSVRNIKFVVEGVKTGGKQKEERVMSLAPYIAAHQVYVDRDQGDLIEEVEKFGMTKNYHLLDALCQGTKHWRPFIEIRSSTASTSKESTGTNGRDIETGYSSID